MGKKRKHQNGHEQREATPEGPSEEELVAKFDKYYDKIVGQSTKLKIFVKFFDFLLSLNNNAEARRKIAGKLDVKFLSAMLVRYTATQNEHDRYIFESLKFIERTLHVSMKVVAPVVFGEKSKAYYTDLISFGRSLNTALKMNQVLSYFDKDLLKKTAYTMVHAEYMGEPMNELYDPRFVLMLFQTMVKPGSDLSCQLFVTSNALHFCLAALSLNSWELRAFAYRVLNDYNKLLQDLNTEAFEQSALLIHLFRVLRTSVLEPCQRIASPVTRFLCEVVDVSMDPLGSMFSPVWSALCVKPFIELDKLPEWIKFFHSTALQTHSRERSWILDVAAQSVQCPADYMPLCRVYVPETCMSAFGSPVCHRGIKLNILKVFKALVRYSSVARDLTMRCCFPTWLAHTATDPETTRFEHVFLTQIFCSVLRHFVDWPDSGTDVLMKMTFTMNAEKMLNVINREDDDGRKKFAPTLTEFLSSGTISKAARAPDADAELVENGNGDAQEQVKSKLQNGNYKAQLNGHPEQDAPKKKRRKAEAEPEAV